MTRLLGPVVSPTAIERTIADLLQPDRNLIGLYLDEVTRNDTITGHPIDRVERPRRVAVRERIATLADDQLPALIVVCPGTLGDPDRDGDGNYSATFSVGVTAVTQSSDEAIAREVASIHVAAVSLLLLECLGASGQIVNVRWKGYASDDIDYSDDRRSRCAYTTGLEVDISDVLTDSGGPPPELADPDIGQPPADAGDLPTVLTTELDVTPVETI